MEKIALENFTLYVPLKVLKYCAEAKKILLFSHKII